MDICHPFYQWRGAGRCRSCRRSIGQRFSGTYCLLSRAVNTVNCATTLHEIEYGYHMIVAFSSYSSKRMQSLPCGCPGQPSRQMGESYAVLLRQPVYKGDGYWVCYRLSQGVLKTECRVTSQSFVWNLSSFVLCARSNDSFSNCSGCVLSTGLHTQFSATGHMRTRLHQSAVESKQNVAHKLI
jgi:hypothetical protein